MGDSITVQHKENNTTVSLCQDSRPVIVIAYNTDGTVTETVKRMKKNGTRETHPCPSSIAHYNRFMAGVDCNDQIRGYYNTPIKCRKCYKYIFWFVFNVAITKRFCQSHFPTRGSDQVHTTATNAQTLEKNVEPRCGFAKTAVYFSTTMAQKGLLLSSSYTPWFYQTYNAYPFCQQQMREQYGLRGPWKWCVCAHVWCARVCER